MQTPSSSVTNREIAITAAIAANVVPHHIAWIANIAEFNLASAMKQIAVSASPVEKQAHAARVAMYGPSPSYDSAHMVIA